MDAEPATALGNLARRQLLRDEAVETQWRLVEGALQIVRRLRSRTGNAYVYPFADRGATR